MKQEYEQILEKLPEGLLITDELNEAVFMNQELRSFLNVREENYHEGLYMKMFK